MKKIRKCTKCEKKYDREDLIKCRGNLYCETCSKEMNKMSWKMIGIITLTAVVLFTIYFLVLRWMFKEKDEKK